MTKFICMWDSYVFGSWISVVSSQHIFVREILVSFCSFSDCALCSFSPFRRWRQGTGVCAVISHHLTCFIDSNERAGACFFKIVLMQFPMTLDSQDFNVGLSIG